MNSYFIPDHPYIYSATLDYEQLILRQVQEIERMNNLEEVYIQPEFSNL